MQANEEKEPKDNAYFPGFLLRTKDYKMIRKNYQTRLLSFFLRTSKNKCQHEMKKVMFVRTSSSYLSLIVNLLHVLFLFLIKLLSQWRQGKRKTDRTAITKCGRR